jgi:hypothetical protein
VSEAQAGSGGLDDGFQELGIALTQITGKFVTNDLILHLAQLAYNILRLMGQLGMSVSFRPLVGL